jgi:hypothetical protein
VAWVIIGVCLLILCVRVPASDEEKKLERDSWRRNSEMSSAARMSRQRMFVVDKLRPVLMVAGVSAVVVGLVLLILG